LKEECHSNTACDILDHLRRNKVFKGGEMPLEQIKEDFAKYPQFWEHGKLCISFYIVHIANNSSASIPFEPPSPPKKSKTKKKN